MLPSILYISRHGALSSNTTTYSTVKLDTSSITHLPSSPCAFSSLWPLTLLLSYYFPLLGTALYTKRVLTEFIA